MVTYKPACSIEHMSALLAAMAVNHDTSARNGAGTYAARAVTLARAVVGLAATEGAHETRNQASAWIDRLMSILLTDAKSLGASLYHDPSGLYLAYGEHTIRVLECFRD